MLGANSSWGVSVVGTRHRIIGLVATSRLMSLKMIKVRS
jgi:hypothetical protein